MYEPFVTRDFTGDEDDPRSKIIPLENRLFGSANPSYDVIAEAPASLPSTRPGPGSEAQSLAFPVSVAQAANVEEYLSICETEEKKAEIVALLQSGDHRENLIRLAHRFRTLSTGACILNNYYHNGCSYSKTKRSLRILTETAEETSMRRAIWMARMVAKKKEDKLRRELKSDGAGKVEVEGELKEELKAGEVETGSKTEEETGEETEMDAAIAAITASNITVTQRRFREIMLST